MTLAMSPCCPSSPSSSASTPPTPPTPSSLPSYIIVGAGNFGAATALTLVRRGLASRVVLIDAADFPSPRAASHDVNKIVRDDYPDRLYMAMMARAMPQWRADNLYSPFYSQIGMLRADDSPFVRESFDAYRTSGRSHRCEMMPVDHVRRRWNGALATANFGSLDTLLWNPDVGYAEADKALAAVVACAVDAGVEYLVGTVETLDFDTSSGIRCCIGVTLNSGLNLRGDRVLLAAGARCAALLAQSAPDDESLHAGDRLVATGAVSFRAKLHGDQREKFSSVPVLKNRLPEVKGEGMSMLPDGTIKFNCDACFTNLVTFPPTGKTMSVAPEEDIFNVWTGPRFLEVFKHRARRIIEGLYGREVEAIPIDNYRMCWDASTPTHDFLITPHPHCQDLFVASGGSFHGWKFLPVIGDYIVDMMQGCLDAEYAERWAWDKRFSRTESANPTYQIIGDLQDWLS